MFSTQLKNARLARDLTQRELGEHAGIAASVISLFEQGSREPSLANLRKLAIALDVSFDYLLERRTSLTELELLSQSERLLIEDLIHLIIKRQPLCPDRQLKRPREKSDRSPCPTER